MYFPASMSSSNALHRPLALLLCSLILVGSLLVLARFDLPTAVAAKEAAVWLDDGNGHTVKELLSPIESKLFSKTLRETMGLPDHRPGRLRRKNPLASAPTFMKRIYKALDELGVPRDGKMDPAHRDVLERADTVVTFTSKAPPSSVVVHANHDARNRLLYFNTSEVSLDHILLGAELRVHYHPRDTVYMDQHLKEVLDGTSVLHVYLVTGEDGSEIKVAEVVLDRPGWQVINMTLPTLAWLLQPSENRGVRLAVTVDGKKHERTLHSAGVSSAHDQEHLRPILVAFFSLPNSGGESSKPTVNGTIAPPAVSYSPDSNLLSRSPRSLPTHVRGYVPPPARPETACQMKPLYVSFSDLDWQDWVIAPNGYDANFCEGRCDFPMPAEVNATNHAIVQTLIKVLGATKDGDTVPPAACCAPKDLLTISVLYYDYNNNVVLKKYPKMVVKNCACR